MKPVTFEEFCTFYSVNHYADRASYQKINVIWAVIYKKLAPLGIPVNYNALMDYLQEEHERVPSTQKFLYYTILREFQRFQINAEIFAEKYKDYMARLRGYSHARKCQDMATLKRELKGYLKRMKVSDDHATDKTIGVSIGKQGVPTETRDFIIMARYICDYLEITSDEIPVDLFHIAA